VHNAIRALTEPEANNNQSLGVGKNTLHRAVSLLPLVAKLGYIGATVCERIQYAMVLPVALRVHFANLPY